MKKLCLFCLLFAACCLACFAAGAENRMTLMVYMTGSDLESLGGAASADLEEMSAALRDDGVTVAVLTGGASGWQNGIPADRNILWRITRNGMERMEEEKARSMGDPAVLSGFLRRSMELFPADRYALVLWDHGAGPLTGVCFDERFGSATSFGFDRVFVPGRGKIRPEGWHIAHLPTSRKLLEHFSLSTLREIYGQCDMACKRVVLARLPELAEEYIYPYFV